MLSYIHNNKSIFNIWLVESIAIIKVYDQANNKLYQLEGAVEKNNESGNQWFLETDLKRCDCFPDFSCE